MSSPIVIEAIPCLSDNYAWLIFAPGAREAWVVDAGEAAPVLVALAQRSLTLRGLLCTHHHPDHVGGIAAVLQTTPHAKDVEVVGSQHDVAACRIPCATRAVRDGETLQVLGTAWQALATPGHTQGAVSYYAEASAAVFTGDTLFLGGCGRLFEGSAEQQLASLTRLAALPDATQIYCGHEYTQKNLRFAAQAMPFEPEVERALAEVDAVRARGQASVPAPLAQQKRINPFLRTGDARLSAALGTQGALETFVELRRRRDAF